MSFLGFKFWRESKLHAEKNANGLPNVSLRLSCIICGQIEEFEGRMEPELAQEVQSDTGFIAEGVTVSAAGTCRACSNRNN